MRKIVQQFFDLQEKVMKIPFKLFREPLIKRAFAKCGTNVHVAQGCSIKGIENIFVGDGCTIGPGAVLWSTRAKIFIGEKVITGPNITIITGDHRIDLPERFLADVTDEEKLPENDQDVRIEDDVWIGANAIILKGITIAQGCVIAAGAVVTKSTEPFGVYAGVPARRIKDRFSSEDLRRHLMWTDRNRKAGEAP
ncbi:MAG TPA: acyltransferase [Candidatus Fournierella pullicola]|uniref:Acyltransferase n=1 Tax=Candidatus Allofournierella pullicola TaxID=2838596 RepID=A0A9D1V5H9_9FIRM|nr:acyltransferase [Candidatus Fournierella pullicola]